jgi:hypothetical protein
MKINQILQLHEDIKDMEKIAFGNLKQAEEKDTEWEAKVFQALRNFVAYADPANKTAADAVLKDVHDLKAKYPNDLMPNSRTAFRGTLFTKSHYKKFLTTVDPDLIDNSDRDIYVGDIMYSPRSPIQSWTTDEHTANAFAATGESFMGTDWQDERPYPAIIEAVVDDTFIFNTTLTNKIAQYNHIDDENEIIRTSGAPIKCKIYVLASWLFNVRKLIA